MKTKTALILHGWLRKTTDDFYPWLKNELETKKYHVFLPDLPTMQSDHPHLQQMLRVIKQFGNLSIVIGHSLGAVLSMRYAEKNKIDKLFLIAGWDYDVLAKPHNSFWPNKINHQLIIKNTKQRFIIHSDRDPYTTQFIAQEMSQRLKAKFILVKGAGHFLKADGITQIPQLLKYV